MAHKHFFSQLTPQMKNFTITSEYAHHLSRVLRAKCGDNLTLCNGNGLDFECTITEITKENVYVEINTCKKGVSEADVQVNIYVGYPKQDKLEDIIQKATELGAVSITPFYSRYCVVTPKSSDKEQQKNARYQKIALQGAMQSARSVLPKVNMPLTYDQMLKSAAECDIGLFMYEVQNNTTTLHSRLSGGAKTIAVITGSEGGFCEAEVQKAKDNGLSIIGLGPRILRCETAPIAALSAIMALTGNLQ